MKQKLLVASVTVVLILSMVSNVGAYEHQQIENYIAYRIKYIHKIAYNTSIDLSKQRVKKYAQEIVYWSDYYSREMNVNIDPLLIMAIIETETNFVSRSDYDEGASIGISSMRITTAKWIARRLNVNYNKWRMLDATDLGIRFTVYYLGLAYQRYDDLHRIIVSYNQGFDSANVKKANQLYNNYLFKVLGRYNYYHKRISAYGASAADYFQHKFTQLD